MPWAQATCPAMYLFKSWSKVEAPWGAPNNPKTNKVSSPRRVSSWKDSHRKYLQIKKVSQWPDLELVTSKMLKRWLCSTRWSCWHSLGVTCWPWKNWVEKILVSCNFITTEINGNKPSHLYNKFKVGGWRHQLLGRHLGEILATTCLFQQFSFTSKAWLLLLISNCTSRIWINILRSSCRQLSVKD